MQHLQTEAESGQPARRPRKVRESAHPVGPTDDWFTPMDLFLALGAEGVTLDVAGHHEAPVSQLIGQWCDIEDDGLSQSWAGEHVWCNPPYSDIAPWVKRAHEQMRAGCRSVTMLVPANRTEQPWWQQYVEPYRDRGPIGGVRLSTEFIARRPRFGFPGDPSGESGTSPRFGVVALRWFRAVPALESTPVDLTPDETDRLTALLPFGEVR